jgi:hypothetical protein
MAISVRSAVEPSALNSAEFFEAHRTDGEAVRGIPGFQRSVWSSLWLELQEFGALEGAADFVADEHHSFRLAV